LADNHGNYQDVIPACEKPSINIKKERNELISEKGVLFALCTLVMSRNLKISCLIFYMFFFLYVRFHIRVCLMKVVLKWTVLCL